MSRPAPPSDLATDLALGVMTGVGVAAWSGLVLGQVGDFALLPVAGLGVATFVATLLALRRGGAPRGPWWRALDGPAVFILAALLYAPGYDTTIYGSDGTVYLGMGVHLARTGSLALVDELLLRLPPVALIKLFPPFGLGLDAPVSRSPAGLVYSHLAPTVYSTFSQLPSVWLAIGHAAGGLPGALVATPVLAAGGVTAFYLFVRRLAGIPLAAVAAGLLGPALPQLAFARLTMGEAGAQFFLWGGLLGYACWVETRRRAAAVTAGLGLGLTTLARPEYAVFIALALVLHGISGVDRRARVPAVALVLCAGLVAHALILVLVVVPTHYRAALADAVGDGQRALTAILGGVRSAPGLAVAAALIAAIVAMWRAGRLRLAARRVLPVLALAAMALWAVAYARLSGSPALGRGVRWLGFYTEWPVLVLAAAGLPLLARRWWRDPAARLALIVAVVAGAHFLYDPHVGPLPVWGARRLLPAALPLGFAAAAAALAAAARLGRVLAVALAAVVVVVANLAPARELWGVPYYRGASAVAAAIADMFPPGAIVLVDPGLQPALLDVPLTLIYGRNAVQIRTTAGDTGPLLGLAHNVHDRPLYVLRHGLLRDPAVPGFRFDLVRAGEYPLLVPGHTTAEGERLTIRVSVKAYRVIRVHGS